MNKLPQKQTIERERLVMKGVHIITDMEVIGDKIDGKDCPQEGSTIVSE